MCAIQVLCVGRKNTTEKLDVSLPESESTIGRRHLEITLGNSGKIFVTDLNSANGTFIKETNHWKRITNSFVLRDTEIKLGDYITTIRKLLK